MHFRNTILATAAATGAVADVLYVEQIVRHVTTWELPQARSLDSNNNAALVQRGKSECKDAAEKVADSLQDDPIPTADYSLLSAISSYSVEHTLPAVTGCETPSITGSVGSAYTDLLNSQESWWTEHLTDYQDMWHECTDVDIVSDVLTSYISILGDELGSCTAKIAEITSGSGDNDNAAPRPTGAVLAAAGVAAMAGMMAL